MHRNVAGERHELVVLGDEVGLTGKEHHRADLSVTVHVRGYSTGTEFAVGLLAGNVGAFAGQNINRFIHITAGFLKGFLALHHRDAGAIAQYFDNVGRDSGHTIK